MAKYEIKDGVGIIPEGTTYIEAGAFENCKELVSVVIGIGVVLGVFEYLEDKRRLAAGGAAGEAAPLFLPVF